MTDTILIAKAITNYLNNKLSIPASANRQKMHTQYFNELILLLKEAGVESKDDILITTAIDTLQESKEITCLQCGKCCGNCKDLVFKDGVYFCAIEETKTDYCREYYCLNSILTSYETELVAAKVNTQVIESFKVDVAESLEIASVAFAVEELMEEKA